MVAGAEQKSAREMLQEAQLEREGMPACSALQARLGGPGPVAAGLPSELWMKLLARLEQREWC